MSLPRLEKATHISDRLNELASVVKTRSRSSLTDANRILETIAARFFNALFGWELVNLNAEQANYQAVDLGDRHKRIAIQVTNEDSSDKISQTAIKANARKQNSEFDRLIIFFLLSKKPGFPKSFTPLPDCPEIELDEAIAILQRGALLPSMKGKNHFYKMQAEITTWQGDVAGAIEILKRGIAGDDPELLDFLYKYCAELLVKLDRLEEAIELLEKGFNHPALTNKGVMYQSWAKLLARTGRAAEGAAMLEKAIRLPGTPGKIMLYQTCADLMSSLGWNREAIELLKSGMNGPRMGNIASLIMRCAELLAVEGLQEEAVKLLKKGVADYPADRQLRERLEKITTAEMT